MANRSGTGILERFLKGSGPVKARPLALLFMTAGALSFIASLVVFGEEVLCLVGSTLVVFIGLGIILLARQYAGSQEESNPEFHQPGRRAVPPGLRRPPQQQAANQVAAPADWQPRARDLRQDLPVLHLIDHASGVFRQQGADVRLEMVRDERGILRVSSRGGTIYVVVVDENPEPVQVGDVRSLYSVWSNSGADGAIFVSAGPFTDQAAAWANARSILITSRDDLEAFRLPELPRGN